MPQLCSSPSVIPRMSPVCETRTHTSFPESRPQIVQKNTMLKSDKGKVSSSLSSTQDEHVTGTSATCSEPRLSLGRLFNFQSLLDQPPRYPAH